MRRGVEAYLALPALLLATGCAGDQPAAPEAGGSPAISVTSPAFGDGGRLPQRYTCDGPGTSPPLAWTGVPRDAAALALVVDDPDAPHGSYTHWVVVDIPARTRSVGAGADPGGVPVENSSGSTGYDGPCPPSGTHHYRFTVYALTRPTRLSPGASLQDAYDAIADHSEAWGRMVATYSR